MTTKPLYIVFLALFLFIDLDCLLAQQLPLFDEHAENAFILNPGMVGWDNEQAVSVTYRHQWTGMPNAPRTATLGFRDYSSKLNSGIGAYGWFDRSGPTSYIGGGIDYAYHLKFKSEKKGYAHRNRLAIGLSLSVMQHRLNGADLIAHTVGDPLQISQQKSRIVPDAGLGIFYYNNRIYAGISVPQLMALKIRFKDDGNIATLQRTAHLYVNVGGRINVTRPYGKFQYVVPSIWFKYAPSSPINVNLGMHFHWNQMLIVGLSYATSGTLIGDFRVSIKNRVRVGYGISVGLYGAGLRLGVTQEVLLGFVIQGHKGGNWVHNPNPVRAIDEEED